MLIDQSNIDEAYKWILRSQSQSPSTVPILVSADCDSLCAARILTNLFRSDSVPYILHPVSSYDDLSTFEMNYLSNSSFHSVILINCGGIVDLYEYCSVEKYTKLRFYVFDSHRPYHLANIREQNEQILIIGKTDEKFPEEEQEEDEEEEEEEDELSDEDEDEDDLDDEEGGNKRKRRRHSSRSSAADERRQRRKARRAALLDYYRGSSYGLCISWLMYELSMALNKDSNDLLWLAIVGLTDQLVHERIEMVTYIQMVAEMQAEVVKKNGELISDEERELQAERRRALLGSQDSTASLSSSSSSSSFLTPSYLKVGHIAFESSEFRFFLLRHWSLFESMYHSSYFGSRVGIWQEKGREKLKLMLAEMGLSLSECKAPYSFMSESLKALLKDQFGETAERQQLLQPTFGSFWKQQAPTLQISACDVVYSISALLEEPSNEPSSSPASSSSSASSASSSSSSIDQFRSTFWRAYDALAHKEVKLIKDGINLAQKLQEAVVRQGTALINKKKISKTGPFRYVIIEESPDLPLFSRPLALVKLACYLIDCCQETTLVNAGLSLAAQAKAKSKKPMVVCALNARTSSYLVVGVMGTHHIESTTSRMERNGFGVAFRETSERTEARVKHDGFDTSVIEVLKDDLQKFLEYLHSGLVLI